MEVHKGTTVIPVQSEATFDIPRAVTQSQSSRAQRGYSKENDSEDPGAESDSTEHRKNAKKKFKLAKKVKKDGRRNREEKRVRKEVRRQEKRRRKELSKNRGSERIFQQQLSTSVELDRRKSSNGQVVASKPIKKRKIEPSETIEWERPGPSNERDTSSTNSGTEVTPRHPYSAKEEGNDANEDREDLHGPTNTDADSSEDDEKSLKREVRGRSRLSISNRYSPRTWNERLVALRNFKLEHGHTNVPSRDFYDRGLAEFVCQIKSSASELNDEQKDKLRDLGFDWTTEKDKKDRAWDANLNSLEQFYKKHKSFAVHRVPELKKLHRWLLTQRTLQHNGLLREDRKERLEGIGYTDWARKIKEKRDDKIPNTWMRQYNSLKKFFMVNGHSMVPQHKHTENHEGRTLANWVRKQRRHRKNDCLGSKKIDLLEKLNFVWTFDPTNTSLRSGKLRDQRREFDTSLNLLLQYKQAHGSIDDVRGSMMIDDRNVGKWLSKQKSLFRSNALDNDRKARLEEVGVMFDFT